jgi:NAD(P)-dependent dehydrogenase (short-subunit alcohol dehydrogenase family)
MLLKLMSRISAGQVGPVSSFLEDANAPERKDAATLGLALFNNESFEAWSELYTVNAFSIFFVTTAFLGLLDNGAKETKGSTSSVINITSISGLIKVAQNHVRNICSFCKKVMLMYL